MTTILLATRNAHKVAEIRAILDGGFNFLTLDDFPAAPAVVEDAHTFAGNATKKAVTLAKFAAAYSSGEMLLQKSDKKPAPADFVLADDSGLEVVALNGAPGVHSARFAALDSGAPGNSKDQENSSKLLRLLKGIPVEKRTARFRCVLALTPVLLPAAEGASPVCQADELELQTQLAEGSCEGHIGFEPSGKGGFGYDPLFIPVGHDLTFAELGEAVKNTLSHRAKALAALKRVFPVGGVRQ